LSRKYSKSESAPPGSRTNIPSIRECGHRWGLHITATTAIPDDVPVGIGVRQPHRIVISNPWSRHTYWLCDHLGQNVFLIMLRHRSYDRRQRRLGAQAEFFRDLEAARNLLRLISFFGIVGSFLRLKFLDEGICYVRNRPSIPLAFRWKFCILLPFDCDPGGPGHCLCSHAEKLSDCGDMEREEKSSQGVVLVCANNAKSVSRELEVKVNRTSMLTSMYLHY